MPQRQAVAHPGERVHVGHLVQVSDVGVEVGDDFFERIGEDAHLVLSVIAQLAVVIAHADLLRGSGERLQRLCNAPDKGGEHQDEQNKQRGEGGGDLDAPVVPVRVDLPGGDRDEQAHPVFQGQPGGLLLHALNGVPDEPAAVQKPLRDLRLHIRGGHVRAGVADEPAVPAGQER